MMELNYSQVLSEDNVCGIATALILFVVYCIPLQFWKKLRPWQWQEKHNQQQQSATPPRKQESSRRVTIASPLPHPATDTTEVSEETESSETTDDIVKEVFRSPVSTPPQATRPIKIVGKPIRLADIPESPCPALNSALKLKRKLLKQDAVCSRSVSTGSSSNASIQKNRHRRSRTAVSLPKTPQRLPLQRHSSAGNPVSNDLKRDCYLLDRISKKH